MRIVHISDCYAPRLGGIETQVRALAMRQAEQGHEVHVLTATPSPPSERIAKTKSSFAKNFVAIHWWNYRK